MKKLSHRAALGHTELGFILVTSRPLQKQQEGRLALNQGAAQA